LLMGDLETKKKGGEKKEREMKEAGVAKRAQPGNHEQNVSSSQRARGVERPVKKRRRSKGGKRGKD